MSIAVEALCTKLFDVCDQAVIERVVQNLDVWVLLHHHLQERVGFRIVGISVHYSLCILCRHGVDDISPDSTSGISPHAKNGTVFILIIEQVESVGERVCVK